MEIFWTILVIIIIVLVMVAIFAIGLYNGLVQLNNRVNEAFSDITVQLKRRTDLIPNLMNTVKGYMQHEKDVFENVAKARTALMGASNVTDLAKGENMLQDSLKSLFAVAEAYPELKANENFLSLQEELTDTEDKIQASRRFYNSGVQQFNTKIQIFPNNIFAGMLGFHIREFFEVADRQSIENPVEVKF